MIQLEFAEPPIPLGSSQYRGNSGVTIGGRVEIELPSPPTQTGREH